MAKKKFYKVVTEKKEITGVIRDLVLFGDFLKEFCDRNNAHVRDLSDEMIIELADNFWAREHGDD